MKASIRLSKYVVSRTHGQRYPYRSIDTATTQTDEKTFMNRSSVLCFYVYMLCEPTYRPLLRRALHVQTL